MSSCPPDPRVLGTGLLTWLCTGLLEEKGIHPEVGLKKDVHKDTPKDSHKDSHQKDTASSNSGGKDKPSLGERIKNKLHRH